MAEESREKESGTGTLTGEALKVDDVLAGAEPWELIETKMVVWSFAIAGVALLIGLVLVPTSIFH